MFCEKSENWNFLANYAPKKRTMIDREPIVVSIQESDKFDKQVNKKSNLKRWKAEGCQGQEKKTKSFWGVLVRIGFAELA